MNLTHQEATEFYKIWSALIWGVNEMRNIIPKFDLPVYGQNMSHKPFAAIRAELWNNPEWIDEFILSGEHGDLTDGELEILADWRRNFVKDRFIVVRHLKKYSVFLTFDEPVKLYGVCGISNPLSDVVPKEMLPHMIETTLLPFKGKIIYDSLFSSFNISFGSGYRKSLKKDG